MKGKANFGRSLPKDVIESKGFGITKDIEKRVVKGGMAVILGPLCIPKPTMHIGHNRPNQ